LFTKPFPLDSSGAKWLNKLEQAFHKGGTFMKEKRLYKCEEGKVICGVCGGLAKYFDVDPTIVRLIWAALTLVGFSGLIAYIIAALIIPKDPDLYR
jgi:phage shock protein C